MLTKHAYYLRCRVWQHTLMLWYQVRTRRMVEIEEKLNNLLKLICQLKIEYALMKEPAAKMSKSYKVADYFNQLVRADEIRMARKRAKTPVKETQTVTEIVQEEPSTPKGPVRSIPTETVQEQRNTRRRPVRGLPTITETVEEQPNTRRRPVRGLPTITETVEEQPNTRRRPKRGIPTVTEIVQEQPNTRRGPVRGIATDNVHICTGASDDETGFSLRSMENIKTTRRINRKRNKLRNTDKNGKFFKAERKSNKISKASQLKKETHHQSKQDLDSSELETLDLLITCSKLAEENILESQERYMNDRMSLFDSNQLVINGVEWVTIGAMKTVVRKKALCEMNWFGCPAIIVENLLEEVFGVKKLETFDIGAVDYNAISDIIDFMQQTTSLESRDVFRAIGDKYVKLAMANLERNRQRRELRKQLKNKYERR